MKMQCGHDYAGRDDYGTLTCTEKCSTWKAKVINTATYPREGRKAVCVYCRATADSAGGPATGWNGDLPFFQPRPDQDTDTYYDGCKGWD